MSDYGTPVHVDYPHEPGRLYDCFACETSCNCSGNVGELPCIYCAEQEDTLSEFAATDSFAY